MYFKYFFSCPKSELVRDGKLVLENLGEAAVALRDCRNDQQHCTVSDVTANCPLGPGAVIDPHPAGGKPKGFGYKPQYTWLAFDSGREGVQGLIGYDSSQIFSPEKILRRKPIAGATLKDGLEPGREWLIPVARSPAMAYGNLATYWSPAAGGKLQRMLAKQDQWLWDLSGVVQEFFIWSRDKDAGPRPEFDDPWMIERAIEILGVNYRLGRPELAVLSELEANPLSDLFAINCLHALCGFSEWEAWLAELQKKTASDTNPAPEDSTSGSGEPEACPADSAAES
jgi:hypothetical protein